MAKKKKEPDFIQNRVKKMITVTDDWFPCFEGNQVEVTLGMYFFKNYYLILSVWGADDCGVEMQYTALDENDGKAKFDEWKKIYDSIPESGIDRDWFYERGFVRA